MSVDEAATPVPPAPEDIVASDSLARNTLFATANGDSDSPASPPFLTLYLSARSTRTATALYTLALAVGGLFALVMDFGISSSAARFIAERRGDRRAIAAYIADALRLKVAIAGGFGLVLVRGRRRDRRPLRQAGPDLAAARGRARARRRAA